MLKQALSIAAAASCLFTKWLSAFRLLAAQSRGQEESRYRHLLLLCGFAVAIGCRQEAATTTAGRQRPSQTPTAPSPASSSAGTSAKTNAPALKLTLLVVDDAPLTAGLKLLRGEWAERKGGLIELQEWTVEELLAAQQLPADLILYPSRFVGTLVDRNWLRPLRNSVLQSRDLALEDVFPLVRNATLRYGNQVYALSLGEPPLMLRVGPADSVLAARVPPNWEAVTRPLATEKSPLAQPRAAESAARGIAFGRHRSRSIDWFDVDSMEPRITSAPFLKALQQMLETPPAAAKPSESALALSWPGAPAPARRDPTTDPQRDALIAHVPLPTARQVFNPLQEIWEVNEVPESLVCLGFAGRSISVTRGTRNSASAFKLLTWLVSESIASQLSPRSGATIWSRRSQVTKADNWLADGEERDEIAAAVTRQLSSDHFYLLPRIPGVDEYLQIMDDAIATALLEQVPAEKTLENISEQWNSLTDRYGRDRQRVAYRRHLGSSEEE